MLTYTATGCRARARLVLGLGALVALTAHAQVSDPGVRKASGDGGPPPTLPGLSAEDAGVFSGWTGPFHYHRGGFRIARG